MSYLLSVFILAFLLCFVHGKDVGILYEVWHTRAAQAMKEVGSRGGELLTVEAVVRSNGTKTLDDVYAKYNLQADIWNVQPELGFYCLYRKRPGDPKPPVPDCDGITHTAQKHASMLVSAGVDYVAVDVTNWPSMNTETDVAVVRPTEVLFEEWAALRKAGTKTPLITVWPCSPSGSNTWKYLLDTLYNNPDYDHLIFKINGKKVVFIPDNPTCYNPDVERLIQSNGGRNDITTIKIWALFGINSYNNGSWAFFSPCTSSQNRNDYTTSIVGESSCQQHVTLDANSQVVSVSASSSYMVSQGALPFASAGHLRGLTLQRLFAKILSLSPPHVFLSSFNEHIGGRQNSISKAKIAFNMGLPNDSQRNSIWVDTYAAEFSRDMEPTVEGGGRVLEVATSCISLYKTGSNCQQQPQEACCTVADKEIFVNIYSLVAPGQTDHIISNDVQEVEQLRKDGWEEVCSPIEGPSVFCVDTEDLDGRNGPFIIYNLQSPQPKSTALFRCLDTVSNQHFFSIKSDCEGYKTEAPLGFISTQRGGEMLRALRRCKIQQMGAAYPPRHALDLECDYPDTTILGFVR